jgi:hypothetical protein
LIAGCNEAVDLGDVLATNKEDLLAGHEKGYRLGKVGRRWGEGSDIPRL